MLQKRSNRRRFVTKSVLLVSTLILYSGQACPPDPTNALPVPDPIPGEPGPPGEQGPPGPAGSDASVESGVGVIVNDGVASLDIDFTDARYWKLGGNVGMTDGTRFLGTTDDQPLELHVNNSCALRLEPTPTCPNVIGGSAENDAGSTVVAATIAGGGPSDPNNPMTGNVVHDDYGAIGGGGANVAGNADDEDPTGQSFGTVAGGFANVASGRFSAVGGGERNTASRIDATVAGGRENSASGPISVVAGGINNRATDQYASVGGGSDNAATGYGSSVAGGIDNEAGGYWSTIGGGLGNQGSDIYATVAGGKKNAAAYIATVAGGESNFAGGNWAAIAGGGSNTASGASAAIGGGYDNTASKYGSTVAGGVTNIAGGTQSTVPGGRFNEAIGPLSFAAGHRAKADHGGAFVWGDSNVSDVESFGDNTFTVRASGGTRFYSSADMNAGVELAAGAGAWSNLSDRNAKENFDAVDPGDVLERVALMPISTWNYKTQDDSIRHIGPMAQDFHAVFGVGHDERRISSVDADGVALAAVQGLHRLVRERDARIAALEARLEARLTALENRLNP